MLNYSDFKTDISRKSLSVSGVGKVKFNSISNYTDAYGESSYNIVTAKLSEEKGQPNGYFVLIALSIGTILLQQFISMRSQKEQTQFSSVDGQAASTQKMTLVIMTLMFAVFAFMYSAAFSIYMVTSNLTSLITTLVINKLVDVAMRKRKSGNCRSSTTNVSPAASTSLRKTAKSRPAPGRNFPATKTKK